MFPAALVLYSASSPPLSFAAKALSLSLGCPSLALAAKGELPAKHSQGKSCLFCFWNGLALLPPGDVVVVHYLSAPPEQFSLLLSRSPGARVKAVLGDGLDLDSLAQSCGAKPYRLPFACPPLTPLAPGPRRGIFAFGPGLAQSAELVSFLSSYKAEHRPVSFIPEKEAARLASEKEKILFFGKKSLEQGPGSEELLLLAPFLAAGAQPLCLREEELGKALHFPQEKYPLLPDWKKGLEDFISLFFPTGNKLALYGSSRMWRLARRTWPGNLSHVFAAGHSAEELEEVGRELLEECPSLVFQARVEDKNVSSFKETLASLLREKCGTGATAELRSFSEVEPGVELISYSHVNIKGELLSIWEISPPERHALWAALGLPAAQLLEGGEIAQEVAGGKKSRIQRPETEPSQEIVCICSSIRKRSSDPLFSPEGEREMAARSAASARAKYPGARILLLDYTRLNLRDLDILAESFDGILLPPSDGDYEKEGVYYCLALLLRAIGPFSFFLKLDGRYSFVTDTPGNNCHRSTFLKEEGGDRGVRQEIFSLYWPDFGHFLFFLESFLLAKKDGDFGRRFQQEILLSLEAPNCFTAVDFWGIRGVGADGREIII